MRKPRRVLVLVSLSLALLAPAGLFAQGPPHHPGDRSGHMGERKKIRENIETLRMYKLLEALDLTSEQSTQFLPALKEFQDARKKFQEERRELLMELEAALEPQEVNEKELEETLAALEDARKEFHSESETFFEKARTMLTSEQRARLHLFEERFERRLKESIRQIRGKEHRMQESR